MGNNTTGTTLQNSQDLKQVLESITGIMRDIRENTSAASRKTADEVKKAAELKKKVEGIKDSIDSINDAIKDTKRERELLIKYGTKEKDILDDIRDSEEKLKKIQSERRKISKEIDGARSDQLKTQKLLLKDKQLEKKYEEELTNLTKKKIEVEKTGYNSLDRFSKNTENRFKLLKQSFKEIGEGAKQIGESVTKALGPWGKMSQAAANYAKQIGLSGKAMDDFRKRSISLVDKGGFGIKYNVGVEQLMKLQESFVKNTGRQVMATNAGMESMAATSKILGDNTGQFMGRLENFGLSMEEAGKRAGKMFASASKKGLVWENLSKAFLDNISLAQRYTFKNGLQGLASMAEKASQINLNMSQAAAFADKVSTVEGAITTGAQLQVLGGPFAQMADPLGMLYEGLNDMEGLQDRMIQMFGNLGSFNRRTGEVEISSFNRQRIKAAAQSMGLDANNLFESINSNARRNEIARQISGNTNIDKDTAELLKNVGIIQNGTAGAVINGKFKSAKNITSADVKYLREVARTESEDVKDIAQRLRGWDDSIQGFKAQKEATHANMVESMGIGKGIQSLVNTVGEMRMILYAIAGGRVISGVAGAVGGAFNMVRGGSHLLPGARNIFSGGLKGTKGGMPKNIVKGGLYEYKGEQYVAEKTSNNTWKAVNQSRPGVKPKYTKDAARVFSKGKPLNAAAKLGKFAKGANIAGWVGLGGELLLDAALASGAMKTGSAGDYVGHAGSRALSMGALGASIGSAIAPGIGTAIGAAIGGIGGLASGIFGTKARDKANQKSKIQEKGLHLNGDYSLSELKKINAAIEGNEFLSGKLMAKMKENGDAETVNEIESFFKNEVVKVQVVKAQKKAGGGIVEGNSRTGDRIPVMTNAGEMVLNMGQQKALFNAINNSANGAITPIVPRPDTKINVTPSVPAPEKPIRIEFGSIDFNFRGDDINIKGTEGVDKTLSKQLQAQIADALTPSIIAKVMDSLNHGGRTVPQRGYEFGV